MSLDFDFSAVKDFNRITSDPTDPERGHPVTDAIIWASLTCGYSAITEKNVDKVTGRILELQALEGPFIKFTDGRKAYVNRKDVENHIGAKFGGRHHSTMTDAQWTKEIGRLTQNRARDLAIQEESAFDFYNRIALELASKSD